MLPKGHRGIIVCDTRRAERWRAAVQANAMVTEVTSGQRDLPGDRFGWRSALVLLLASALIAAMLAR